MKTIILTGGGTAGHVTPHFALMPQLKQHYQKIEYIGTNGIEKELAQKNNIPFHQIDCTKLERKLTLKTFAIPFKLIKSINAAKKILKQIKPNVVFSKGGFVALPVCIAAKKLNIPVISHESDLTLGLANKIIKHYANVVCTSFQKTANGKKLIYTGSPINANLYSGNAQNVFSLFNHSPQKQTLLFFGGSLGAKAINNFVEQNIKTLTEKFNVLHISGKQGINRKNQNYFQTTYVFNMQDFYAAADIVICRSGANSIMELKALNKKSVLIPLPKGNSRGDQVENAKYFESQNLATVLQQENLTINNLLDCINKTKKLTLKTQNANEANKKILEQILKYSK